MPADRPPAAPRRRPRVLLIAEACNPEWVSVPLVGFNFFDAIRRQADVTLVTQIRNRGALERRCGHDPRIHFIDSEALAAPLHRLAGLLTFGRGLGWTTRQALMWGPYLYFEWLVYQRFRRALAGGHFDVVHRVTPLSPTYASPLARLTRTPFMIGPLNGGLPWPPGTTATRLSELEFLSYLRGAYKLLPGVSATYARAACVIAGSRHTRAQLPAHLPGRVVYMQENGIDPQRFHPGDRRPPSAIQPFRILFVGRLVPYKGADVVLEAFADSPLLRAAGELVIVGDGPQAAELHATAEQRGVTRSVRFVGRVPQEQVPEHFRAASVFAFPSLREFGGAVVLEAMACGLPCVILDYGGPAEFVTPECGVLLPLADRAVRVTRMRNALESLFHHRDRLDRMSAAGRTAVADRHTWQRKAERIVAWYGECGRPARPSEPGGPPPGATR